MTNPLLTDWTGAFALPPFAEIRDADFAPAFDAALAEARANIAAIAAAPEPPDFANTIEALEQAERLLDRVAGVFYNLSGADSTPAREALMRDLAPKMAAFSSEVTMNKALFARIDQLWQARGTLGLSAEQGRLLAQATFAGATALSQQSDVSPAVLRERVTSKGGTTYAALTHLESKGVKDSFVAAMRAAQQRAAELGDEFGR